MAYNLPPELIENFKKNQASMLVGAGLSMSAGFPNWLCLLEIMIDKYSNLPHANAEKIEDYKNLIKDNSKFLLLAEDLKESLNFKFYTEVLEETFGRGDVHATKNHDAIIKLNPSFIITLNYDRLIENAFNRIIGYFPNVYTYKQSREAANAFWKNKFFIFKAHGDAFSDSSNLILTQKDYRKVLFRESGYRSLLQTMFTSKSILLLGLSMSDPELNLMLDFLHESYHTGGPIHYMLTDKKDTNRTMIQRYLDDFNIQTITFDNDDGKFGEITDFLEELNVEVAT